MEVVRDNEPVQYPCLTVGCDNLADEGHGTCVACRAEVVRRLGRLS